MKIFVCVLSLLTLVGAALPPPLRGQAIDLVELKKKEEERRKKLTKSKYILTDNNLAKVSAEVGAKRSSFIQIEVTPGVSGEGEAKTEAAAASSSAPETPAGTAENTETGSGDTQSAEQWKSQKADIDNRITQYRDEINREQSNLNKLWTDFYLQEIPNQKEQIRIQIDALNSKIENLKTMLNQAEQELQGFLAKARKAGVPPGWLR